LQQTVRDDTTGPTCRSCEERSVDLQRLRRQVTFDRSARPERNLQQIQRFLEAVDVLPPDESAPELYGCISAQLAQAGSAEDFGILGADEHDTHQQEWLLRSLKSIADNRQNGTRNALVIATHHPPYSQGLSESGQGHPGSPEMLAQLDAPCKEVGIWPDMVLSGHSHNYQRSMRTVTVADGRKKVVIPYLIAGTGGIGSQPVPFNIGNMDANQTVTYANALGSVGSEHTVYGYLRVHVSGNDYPGHICSNPLRPSERI
jgi:hypothetical protein